MEQQVAVDQRFSQYVRKQYAIYLRKSRADMEMEALGEGETLARHQHMLEALAQKHEIHPDQITIYREVVSGDSISERPEMQRLLADVYAKKYAGVLVVEVERLARGNTKDQGEVADAFQVSDTKIITPMKIYDPNNEFDQEYFEFGLFMSRREYKTIKRRLEAGKKQSVMEGNYILPQRILGYNIVRTSKKDRYLVENPEEAKIVHMIFDWFTESKRSTGWIAQELTRMGVPTMKKLRGEWNRGTIRDMLSNVHYIGLVWWNKQNTVKEFDEKAGKLVKVRKKNTAPEVFKGKHKGIISEEQFQKAQNIIESQKQPSAKVNTEIVSPLAGILACCECGRQMKLQTYPDNRRSRYAHPRSITCTRKSVAMTLVIDAVTGALRESIGDFEMKMQNGNNQSELLQHAERIQLMEAELAKLEKKKRRLFDSWEADDGTYTHDEFIERKQMYTRSIDEIKKQIQEAKQSAPEPVDFEERIYTIRRMISCLENPNLPAKEKNDFLKQYIEVIKYDAIDFGPRKGGKPVLELILK